MKVAYSSQQNEAFSREDTYGTWQDDLAVASEISNVFVEGGLLGCGTGLARQPGTLRGWHWPPSLLQNKAQT